jgi:hypothetical protein
VRVLVDETADMMSSREGRGGLGIDMLDERLVGDGLAAISVQVQLKSTAKSASVASYSIPHLASSHNHTQRASQANTHSTQPLAMVCNIPRLDLPFSSLMYSIRNLLFASFPPRHPSRHPYPTQPTLSVFTTRSTMVHAVSPMKSRQRIRCNLG